MKGRLSNFEFFRCIAMMAIVAYHAAWYSGLATMAYADPWTWSNAILLWLGAWGKTGINCFILITGYFMCDSKLTIRRFLKVIGVTVFYSLLVYGAAILLGRQQLSIHGFFDAAFLFAQGVNYSFVPSYLALLLLSPLLNCAIRKMGEWAHAFTAIGMLTVFCMLPSFGVKVCLGEIPWFVALYFIAAFVRLHSKPLFEAFDFWREALGVVLVIAFISMVFGAWFGPRVNRMMIYYWVFPDVKILAFAVAFCGFMFFKNWKVSTSRFVNLIGGSTFGVYLLHDGALGDYKSEFWRRLISLHNSGGGGDSYEISYVCYPCFRLLLAC